MIRLRTIDVWDTLLRRRCHPDAVKLHVAGWLLMRCWTDIAPSARTPRKLLALRLEAERELARMSRADPTRDDEYELRDVLHRWACKAMSAGVTDHVLVDALQTEEIAQERWVSYADPNIKAWLSARPAVPTEFLSDFYMSATTLARLLDDKGLGGVAREGNSSCDLGLNKRSGRLFQAVQKRHGITPQQHQHVGDNRQTDVRVPRRLGMQAERYRNRQEERKAAFNARVFRDRSFLTRCLERDILRTSQLPEDRVARTAFRFGVRSAPLFIGFALFLLEQASRERHPLLCFLSREGEFFAGVYDALRDGGVAPGGTAPPPLRLDVSRRSTFAASLRDVSVNEMQRIWRAYAPMSMRTWALSCNLDLALIEPCCQSVGLEVDESLEAPARDTRVRKLFSNDEFRSLLREQFQHQAHLLRAYLAQHAVDESTRELAVVDIGWRGTIQDNLASLLPSVSFCGYYLGLQGFLSPQSPNTKKCAYGPDANIGLVPKGSFAKLPLMEMLCTPARGGVIGYRQAKQGDVAPLHTEDEDHGHPIWHRAVGSFQAGVMQAVPPWTDALRTHAVDSTELRDTAMNCWHDIIHRAPTVIRRARSTLAHDERFGWGRKLPPVPRRRSWKGSIR